tara:strand:- start:2353 stop:3456 length:1104 start_codon:yes stop_codon:yes gene_type:complete
MLSKLSKNIKIVLASESPRRKEILSKALSHGFTSETSGFAETLDKSLFSEPYEYAVENARQKALAVANRKKSLENTLVIGSDTIIVLDGEILEKPLNSEHAVTMLKKLSGKSHSVYTGVALVALPDSLLVPSTKQLNSFAVHSFFSTTTVNFENLEASDIDTYVASGEPFGKAGAYGIQGSGGCFVKSISGCFYNVMGFPLSRFCKEMRNGINSHFFNGNENESERKEEKEDNDDEKFEVWELKSQYYQVLGDAWDHETKDFKVVYRPLYHCPADSNRFEAHNLACSHFSRWNSKFRKCKFNEIPEKIKELLLPGPFVYDKEWKFANRTVPMEKREKEEVNAAVVSKVATCSYSKSGYGTRSFEMYN